MFENGKEDLFTINVMWILILKCLNINSYYCMILNLFINHETEMVGDRGQFGEKHNGNKNKKIQIRDRGTKTVVGGPVSYWNWI